MIRLSYRDLLILQTNMAIRPEATKGGNYRLLKVVVECMLLVRLSRCVFGSPDSFAHQSAAFPPRVTRHLNFARFGA